MKKHDLTILGAGMAGLSAALYAVREGLKVQVADLDTLGGTLNLIEHLDNYPGLEQSSGQELKGSLLAQLGSYDGVELAEFAEIDGLIDQRPLIIATGASPRKLEVPGEAELIGRGISYCTMCDAPLYRDREVMVVGGGNSAVWSAIALAKLARRVVLVNRSPLCASSSAVGRLRGLAGVEIVENEKVERFSRGEKISVKTDQSEYLVDGVFVQIGNHPNSEVAQRLGLELDEGGAIVVDDDLQTSMRGVFAAGDVRSGAFKQLVGAASDGARSAMSVVRYLRRQK